MSPNPPSRVVLDHTAYPHIMSNILEHRAAWLSLRGTCKYFKAICDAHLLGHTHLHSVSPLPPKERLAHPMGRLPYFSSSDLETHCQVVDVRAHQETGGWSLLSAARMVRVLKHKPGAPWLVRGGALDEQRRTIVTFPGVRGVDGPATYVRGETNTFVCNAIVVDNVPMFQVLSELVMSWSKDSVPCTLVIIVRSDVAGASWLSSSDKTINDDSSHSDTDSAIERSGARWYRLLSQIVDFFLDCEGRAVVNVVGWPENAHDEQGQIITSDKIHAMLREWVRTEMPHMTIDPTGKVTALHFLDLNTYRRSLPQGMYELYTEPEVSRSRRLLTVWPVSFPTAYKL